MAIATNCPHCGKAYRVKDELNGKRANCTNPNCKKIFTIQAPTAPAVAAQAKPASPPTPKPNGNVEDLAMAALVEEARAPEKAAEQVAAPVKVKCQFCDHENVFEARMAGKNAPCQNEECRKIIKVPLPAKADPKDWRNVQKRPTAAKVDQPEMEGAWGNVETQAVSREALQEAEANRVEEREPRSWGRIVVVGLLAAAFLVVAVVGVGWMMRKRAVGKQDKAMQMAMTFVSTDPKVPSKLKKDQAGLLHMLAGEYELGRDRPKEAKDHLVSARSGLDQPGNNAPERCAALVEVACLQASLAGTREQIEAGKRYDYDKDRIGVEVRSTLTRLPAGPGEEARDMRAHAFRRLARILAATGNIPATGALASTISPVEERGEMLGVIGLELLALGRRDDAERVATQASAGQPGNAESLIALWMALGAADAPADKQKVAAEKARAIAPPPARDAAPSATARIGYAEGWARQGRIDEARKLAWTGGKPEERLRAGIAVAAVVGQSRKGDATDLEQCAKLLDTELKSRPVSGWLLLRLIALCNEAGKSDLAARFAGVVPDQGLRTWARYEVLRGRLRTGGSASADTIKEVGDEKWLAHWLAWSELARQLATAGNASSVMSEVKEWTPEPRQAFGLAGVALAER